MFVMSLGISTEQLLTCNIGMRIHGNHWAVTKGYKERVEPERITRIGVYEYVEQEGAWTDPTGSS